jgi:hypothetical protein
MRRATVRRETSNPSLSNSPWMRGAPQRGFASAVVRTSSASSEPTGDRPVRPRCDFRVQKARKPCRCQRITVSGRTTCSASRLPAPPCRVTPRRRDLGSRVSVASSGGARRVPSRTSTRDIAVSLASLLTHVQRGDLVLANDRRVSRFLLLVGAAALPETIGPV